MLRLRVTFTKNGPLLYTSHLDLARIWERSLRRAGAPLVYSQGFNPRPKLHLAAALPLGHVGEAELLDVWLERPTSVEAFTKALGTGIHAPANWHGVWVVNLRSGQPKLEFTPALAALLELRGVGRCHLSLSDEREFASATVILESGA